MGTLKPNIRVSYIGRRREIFFFKKKKILNRRRGMQLPKIDNE